MSHVLENANENWGLLANGASGRWYLDVDENPTGTSWLLEIENSALYLTIQLERLDILIAALRFLQLPSGDSRQAADELNLGRFGSADVSLVWDDEDFTRCFLIVNTPDQSTLRLSLYADDVEMLCDALQQVVEDLPEDVANGSMYLTPLGNKKSEE